MRIRNLKDPNFDQVVLGIKFEHGESQGHFNFNQIAYLKAVGGFEFEEIAEPCPECEKLKVRIKELEEKLARKRNKD